MAELMTALPEPLFSILQREKFLLLSTLDHETGAPSVHAISWVYAKDPATIRFAIDQRSTFLTDMNNNPLVTLTFIGAGSVFAIYGTARVAVELLEGVPIKLACVDVDIHSVRDAMFYGSRIVTEPEYEKTYDKRAAEKLDGQVFESMKKA